MAASANPPITLQALVAIAAPCDNTATPESDTWKQNEHAPVPSTHRGHKIQELYVGIRGSANWHGNEWPASPLLAPQEVLRNCSPVLLSVPRVDIYYAENIEMYEKLQEAGVDVRLKEYSKAVHPFLSMDKVLPSGEEGIKDLVNFVKQNNVSLVTLRGSSVSAGHEEVAAFLL